MPCPSIGWGFLLRTLITKERFMPAKNFGNNKTLMNKSISSSTPTETSDWVSIQNFKTLLVSFLSTNESSFSATLTLESSIDKENVNKVSTVTDSSVAFSGNDYHEYDLTITGGKWIRLKAASINGSADVLVEAFGKE